MMPDKAFIRKLLEFLDFPHESGGDIAINPGLMCKQPDHNMFVGPFSNGATQETGVALMQNINDAVIVNVFSTFSNFIATRGTDSDLFGYRLITLWAKFHKLFSGCWWLQTIGPARPLGRGGLKRLEEILHSLFV
jgi:hypothetical protein